MSKLGIIYTVAGSSLYVIILHVTLKVDQMDSVSPSELTVPDTGTRYLVPDMLACWCMHTRSRLYVLLKAAKRWNYRYSCVAYIQQDSKCDTMPRNKTDYLVLRSI